MWDDMTAIAGELVVGALGLLGMGIAIAALWLVSVVVGGFKMRTVA